MTIIYLCMYVYIYESICYIPINNTEVPIQGGSKIVEAVALSKLATVVSSPSHVEIWCPSMVLSSLELQLCSLELQPKDVVLKFVRYPSQITFITTNRFSDVDQHSSPLTQPGPSPPIHLLRLRLARDFDDLPLNMLI